MTIVRSNYREIGSVLKELGIPKVDGIMLDLGVSSYQLDEPRRGFTYKDENALLDMRMDTRQSRTAKDILQDYSEGELYRIIRDYGEDRFAKNIAKHIVAARQKKPIEKTGELNEIIGRHYRQRYGLQADIPPKDLSGAADRIKPGIGGTAGFSG